RPVFVFCFKLSLTAPFRFPYKLIATEYQPGVTMETVGFIGLGNMGGPVASHIQRARFPMVVCDLREQATRPFRERGATVVDSASELARRSDVIITALPMPKDVEQVTCGAKGILEGIRPQSVYI